MTMSKLSELRAGKQKTAMIHPDLTNPPKDTPLSKDVSIADKTTSLAIDYARMAMVPKAPEGNETDAWFATLTPQQQAAWRFEFDVSNDLKAADDVATSVLRWHFDLVAIYTVPSKDDATKTVCLLDEWPVPDTKTGNNPAIREEIGPKKDGTTGNVKVDFYNVLAASFPKGKALRADMESLSAGNPKTGNPSKVKSEHSLLSEDQRQARLVTVTKQWQRFRTTIKDAIWIRVQWAAIKAMPLIDLDYIYDKEFDPKTGAEISKEITTSTTPFAIWPKGNDTQKIPYSATNFIKLDPAKAMKDGGTLLALRNSAKKSEPATPADKVGEMTVDTAEKFVAALAAFLSNETKLAALYSKACKPEGSSEGL